MQDPIDNSTVYWRVILGKYSDYYYYYWLIFQQFQVISGGNIRGVRAGDNIYPLPPEEERTEIPLLLKSF